MRKFIITNLSKGAVSISSQQIVEVGDGPSSGGNFLLLSGGTMTGNIKSPDASQPDELATLGQVDQAISEIDISADEVTETATREFVSPSEKATWDAKQDKAPTDGKTYGLKDGGLVQLPLVISDGIYSSKATATNTFVLLKEYDLGILSGKNILQINLLFKKINSSGSARSYVRIYNTITAIETEIVRGSSVASTALSWNVDRQISLNESIGKLITLETAAGDNTDAATLNSSVLEYSISFNQPLKLRIYGYNIASNSEIQQYSGLIQLR